jgi:predicted PurR-regulated permease PerM
MTEQERNRLVARAVVLAILGGVLAYALYVVRDVLLTLYISSLLAVGISPLVRRIEARRFASGRVRFPRWVAILSIYVGFLFVIALVVALVAPPLVAQGRQLAVDLPGYVDRLQRFLVERELLDATWSWSSLFTNLQLPGMAISGIFGAVSGVLGVAAKVVMVLVLPFYLLLESVSIKRGFLRLLRAEHRVRAERIVDAATVKVGAWLGGQLLLGAVIGTSSIIVLGLFGVPYFYVLGLIAAIGELIPVVGPILASVPAILLAFTVSPQIGIGVALFCWIQQAIENNFLVPRIMERQVGVSSVAIIVALLVGSTLLGFVGAILAVPSAAIIQVVLEEHFRHQDEAAAV